MVKVRVGGESSLTSAEGNGPVNALDLALRRALIPFYPCLTDMRLADYKVRVLESDATTAAVCACSSSPRMAKRPGGQWSFGGYFGGELYRAFGFHRI